MRINHRPRRGPQPLSGLAAAAVLFASTGSAGAWTLQEASAPYRGTTIRVVGLDRPSYDAMKQLIPDFEKTTGINVKVVTYPYESALEAETLDFASGTNDDDVILSDLIWTGDFATSRWVQPVSKFTSNPKLADPSLDLNDFVPQWLDAFKWGPVLYGLPFDSYSGLLYYNNCMLKQAGFDKPPATWEDLLHTYAPKLTDPQKGIYAFALQSRRGETQSADSFTRMLWDFGGSWLDPKTFEPNTDSPGAVRGMEFRKALMQYMPPGIVSDDHGEVVQLLAQGKGICSGRPCIPSAWTSFISGCHSTTSPTFSASRRTAISGIPSGSPPCCSSSRCRESSSSASPWRYCCIASD
jgi:multiple sugar transport system substrate-binding protein